MSSNSTARHETSQELMNRRNRSSKTARCSLYLLFASVILCIALYSALNNEKSPMTHSETIATHEIPFPNKEEVTNPLQDGSGSFKHNNTIAPEEERVFPLFDNKGKTAIVTGAGAGIGLAVAQGLAESGANVAIWYHGNKKAIDRAKEIEEEYGVKCKWASTYMDLADPNISRSSLPSRCDRSKARSTSHRRNCAPIQR